MADAPSILSRPTLPGVTPILSRCPAWTARTVWVAWAAIVVFAAVVRLANLGEPSLTHDEAWRANWSLYGTLSQARQMPPLVYALNHVNQRFLGRSEFTLRLPSALAGILTVAVMFELARSRFGVSVGLCVAAVAAVHPELVGYARVMKEFSFEALISTLGLWAGWNAWRDWRPVTFRIFAGFALLAFASAYTAPLVVAAWAPLLALAAWRQHRCAAGRPERPVATADLLIGAAVIIVAGAVSAWWLTGAAGSAARTYHYQMAYHVWPASYAPSVLAAWLGRSLFGALRFTVGMEPLWTPANWVFGTVAALALSAALPNLWRTTPEFFAYGALLLGGAVVAAAARQWPLGPLHCSIFLVPPGILALGVGLQGLVRRLGRTPVVLAIVTVFGVYPAARAAKLSLVNVPTPEHLRPVLQYVADHKQPADAVFVYYAADDGFEFYWPRLRHDDGPVLVQPRMDRINFGDFTRRFDAFIGEHPRVWFVMAHQWGDERVRYLAYLSTQYRLLAVFDITEASAHLFLGDAGRNGQGTAPAFPE